MNRASTDHTPRPSAEKTQARAFLNRHCTNLTRLAGEGKLTSVMEVHPAVKTAVKILLQPVHSVPLLVGNSPLVNRQVAEGLAGILLRKNMPAALAGKTMFAVETAKLARYKATRADYPEYAANLVRSARSLRAVLYIDNLCAFCELNFNEDLEVETKFKSALADGSLVCLAASPCAAAGCLLGKHANPNPLQSFLTPLEAPVPNVEDCMRFLRADEPLLKEAAGNCIELADEALAAAAEFSVRYFANSPLPEAAVELLKAAVQDAWVDAQCDAALLNEPAPLQKVLVDLRSVAQVVQRLKGFSREDGVQADAGKLLHMEDALRQRVLGQEEAIKAVADALRIAGAGFKNPNRPVGVFLLAGSTGTGKTELARALAECLYGDVANLVRVDMSEYIEYHTVSRLFGSPPGYVGYDQGGQLTNAVLKNPRCVVLLDEIDKAHPAVLNSFLQVFDDGRLTDGQGRTVSFAETIIIMTTNLGHEALGALQANRLGFCPNQSSVFSPDGLSQYQNKVVEAVTKELRPEFVNRITRMVVFNPLDSGAIRKILDKTIQQKMELVKGKHLTLELSGEVYALLEKEGFNPAYGAREAERAVERFLIQPLAVFLLNHPQVSDAALQVSLKNGEVQFSNSISLVADRSEDMVQL